MRTLMVALVFATIAASSPLARADVLTRRNDNSRAGVNAHETVLTQANVKRGFARLWTLFADAKIMAQPLYVSNLRVPVASIVGDVAKEKCASGCNAVIFATMKGTIYAYMADQKPLTDHDTLLWATYLSDGNACHCGATGPQNGSGNFDMWAVDDPWWGILSTPVIDRTTNSLYVVDWTNDQQYRVYNLNITTGTVQKGPVVVQGTVGNQTFAPNNAGWIQRRKQRAGLLLSNGLLYVAFGGDNPDALAGWLFVYDAASLALKTVWSPTPGGRNGGIWMAGDAPAADGAGNVYLQTGDGDLAPNALSFGDSLMKLAFKNGAINVAGFFSPCNQMLLRQCDLDQGSAGAVLFDAFVVGGGKDGKLYLMKTDKMPGYKPGPFPPTAANCLPGEPPCSDSSDLVQKWQASRGHIHGAPAVWKGPNNSTWLYVMGEGDRLKAFPFGAGTFNVAAMKQGGWTQPILNTVPDCQQANHGMWMPGGIISVSSNGTQPGTGIVWGLVPTNGDGNSCRGVKGMLIAFNAEDVTKELFRGGFGLLARFAPPTIEGGKVFVPTAGDDEPLRRYGGPRPAPGPANYYLAVFGLR